MRCKEKTEMERRRWKEQVGRKDRKADNKNEKERETEKDMDCQEKKSERKEKTESKELGKLEKEG